MKSTMTISPEDWQAKCADCQVGDRVTATGAVSAMNEDGSATLEVEPESITPEEAAPAEEAAEPPAPPMRKKSPAMAAAVGEDY